MKIMWFCIPAFGHTNPTIELVRELVKRGHHIRYYSFETFREKIEGTGAVYIGCDKFIPEADEKMAAGLKRSSTTAMSLTGIETTIMMNDMLIKEVESFKPDLIVSDSVCFWGKLIAKKYNIPMVCSTTTFAFNQHSAKYNSSSFREIVDIIGGSGKVKKALKRLEPLGYHVDNIIDLVQSKNDTYSIVYASEKFQPCSETFDKSYYCFCGPSVKEVPVDRENNKRPKVYISLGTVVNDHPDFYANCIEALKGEDMDVIISCGSYVDIDIFGKLPDNIEVRRSVNQMEVLAGANLFVTHCGMNSASEGLYMGVPEVLFPQTGEQKAVARRVRELEAGIMLDVKASKSATGIREVIKEALNNENLKINAEALRKEFHESGGYKTAADFIEKMV